MGKLCDKRGRDLLAGLHLGGVLMKLLAGLHLMKRHSFSLPFATWPAHAGLLATYQS